MIAIPEGSDQLEHVLWDVAKPCGQVQNDVIKRRHVMMLTGTKVGHVTCDHVSVNMSQFRATVHSIKAQLAWFGRRILSRT